MKLLSKARTAAAALLLTACVACGGSHSDVSRPTVHVEVVATSTVLASLVGAIGGPLVDVRSIVPAGASVESYEPTPQDVALVSDASVLVENGAGLEFWLTHLLRTARPASLLTVTASDGLPLIEKNPHLWMDPANARVYVRRIARALETADPRDARIFADRAKRFDRRLVALQRDIAGRLAVIPTARRRMIVYHDAWRYYADRFGLRIAGVVEEAPGREPSAAALARLIDVARRADVAVIFSEPEESARLAQAVAASLPEGRVVPLYVDSLDAAHGIVDYPSMLEYDTREIAGNLK